MSSATTSSGRTSFEGPDRLDHVLHGPDRYRKDLGVRLDLSLEAGVNETSRMTVDVIDMFSGCGGMSAGFKAISENTRQDGSKFRHILAIDLDEFANKSYEQNIGLAPRSIDIHELAENPKKVESLLASTERDPKNPLVLIGCAPCQGFSSHRQGAKGDDPRNTLFVDFARIAAQVQPDYVIIENVPEILSVKYWPLVTNAREILRQAGYFTHLTAHNMAEFGVPQERFRAVMTAARTSFTGPTPTVKRGAFSTVRDAIGDLPTILPGKPLATDYMHRTAAHRASTVDTIRSVPHNGGNRPVNAGPKSLRDLAERQGKNGFEDVYGRLAWDKPAITITAHSRNPASGRYAHPEQDRGLSIREAACLQSFPSDYRFEGTLDQAFRQIGNAVPPVFASHVALSVLGHLSSDSHASGAANHCGSIPMDTGILNPVGESFSRIIPALKAGTRMLSQGVGQNDAVKGS